MKIPEMIGETTITSKNQVSLPARGMRKLHWTKGDRLLVQVVDDNSIVLTRRPKSFTEEFSGRLSDVFGTHEEVLQYLEGERRSWDDEDEENA